MFICCFFRFGIHHSTVSGWVKESEKLDKSSHQDNLFKERGQQLIFFYKSSSIQSLITVSLEWNRKIEIENKKKVGGGEPRSQV